MRYALSLIVVLIASVTAHAGVGDWTSYSRLTLSQIAVTADEVWAATEGGIIRSDLANGAVQTFTPTEGLPDKTFYCVALDTVRNVAWFGTEEGGLVRFTRGVTGPVLQSPLLQGQISSVLDLDIVGDRLYVAHKTGVTVLDLTTDRVIETYHQLGPVSELRNQQVLSVRVIDGVIYAGFATGLSTGDVSANLPQPSSWSHVSATVFANTRDVARFGGKIYVATKSGVYTKDPAGWRQTGPTAVAWSLAIHDGALWVGSSNGLWWTPDGDNWTQKSGLTGTVRSVAVARGVMLVAAADEGTFRFTSTSSAGEKVPGVDFPPSDSFEALAIDTSGAVWVAPRDSADGVFCFRGGSWIQYHHTTSSLPKVFDEKGFISVAVDGSNRVWFGTWGRGVAIIDQSTDPPTIGAVNSSNSVMRGLDNDASYVVVSAFLPDKSGAMWAGVFHSLLYSLEPGYQPGASVGITHVAQAHLSEIGLLQEVTSLALDSDDVMWVGSQTSGVSLIYTAGTPGTTSDDIYVGKIGQEGLDASVGLLDRSVHCIVADSRGRMWVGTSSGLTMLSGEYDRSTNTYSLVSTHYTIDRGLPANMVTAVLVDSYDHVWVGTTEGLARITPSGSVIKLSSAKLVDPSGNVSALAYDEANGYIWIGTPRGLNRYEAYSSSGGSDISVQPLQNPFPVELTKQGNMYVLSGPPLTIQVTPGATVRIYTVTGQLVWQGVDGGAGRVQWDGRTRSGHDTVATGIYLYVAERGGVHKTGKIAVVRTIH